MSDTNVILIAILVIWAGVFGYLIVLDRKVARLAKKVDSQ